MLYPSYVWITYGWYDDSDWWKSKNNNTSCSRDEISKLLEGAIALSHYPVSYHNNDKSSSRLNKLSSNYSYEVLDVVKLMNTLSIRLTTFTC